MEDIKKLVKNGDVEFVRVEMPDLSGMSMGYLLDADFFVKSIKSGVSMTQVIFPFTANGDIVFGIGLSNDINYENMGWYPDLSTFRVLPWSDKTASVVVHARMLMGDDQSPLHKVAPRTVCGNQIEKLHKEHGMKLFSTFEYEFFLIDPASGKPIHHENILPFNTQHGVKEEDFARDVMRNMKKIGIAPERFHTEYGPGQYEIASSPSFGVQSCDNAFRLKQLVKEISRNHGYKALWLTKPFHNYSGCSAHWNHSLWSEDGVNMFYDPDMEYGLSKIARSWLAGLIHHSSALMALSSNTPNCVERNNRGGFAPINNAWGLDNRSCAFRTKNHGKKNVYFEMRISGAGTNPYLLQAGCLIAGMDGIKKEMELKGSPYEGDISMATELPQHVSVFPKSLTEAMDCLLKNEVYVEALGEDFVKIYTGLKKYEDGLAEQHKAEGDEALFKWYRDYYSEGL